MARPKGATTKPKITDFMTLDEIEDLVETAKKQAKNNPVIMKFLLEQVFGRPVQPLSNDEDNPLQIQITGINYITPNGRDNIITDN